MKHNQMSIAPFGMTGGLTFIPFCELYKDGRKLKAYYHVISVIAENKYGYYVITQRILHHEIMFIVRFAECDRIEYVDRNNIRKEITPND